MTPSGVREFLGLPSQLSYTDVDAAMFHDIDGRSNDAILGTPGGDAGEFLNVLQVYSDLLGVHLDEESLRDIFTGYVKHHSPRKFYFHSSADAVSALQAELNVESIDLLSPRDDPPGLKENVSSSLDISFLFSYCQAHVWKPPFELSL